MFTTLLATPRLNRAMSKTTPQPDPTPAIAAALSVLTFKLAAIRVPDVSVAKMQQTNNLREHFFNQRTALWAWQDGEATPAQEIEAKAAIVEHAPDHCKEAHALRLFRTCGQTLTFAVPSKSRPGVMHLTTYNPTGLIVCNCKAANCWHIEAARELVVLHRAVNGEAQTVEIDNLTAAAFDAADDLNDALDYVAFFEMD